MRNVLGFVTFFLLASSTAKAFPPVEGAPWQPDPTWGFELEKTTTDQEYWGATMQGEGQFAKLSPGTQALYDAYVKHCAANPGCEVKMVKDKFGDAAFDVTFKQLNYTLTFTSDNVVVETLTQPAKQDEMERIAPTIEKEYFKFLEAQKFRGTWFGSAGHTSFGVKGAFSGNVQFFLDWMADFANHSAFSYGGLLWDPYNAPALGSNPLEKAAFIKWLADGRAGKFQNLQEAARALIGDVYYHGKHDWRTMDFDKIEQYGPEYKYHAVNVTRLAKYGGDSDKSTVEIRSVRGYGSYYEYLTLVKLLKGRLVNLWKTRTEQTARNPNWEGVRYLDIGLIPTPAHGVAQFNAYNTPESGLKFEELKPLMPPEWRREKLDPTKAYAPGRSAGIAETACGLLAFRLGLFL